MIQIVSAPSVEGRGMGWPGSLLTAGPVREIDSPTMLAGRSFQVGIRVYGERIPGEGKHIGVPAGIAKGRVDLFVRDLPQRLRLAGAGGDANQAVGDDAGRNLDFRREDAGF